MAFRKENLTNSGRPIMMRDGRAVRFLTYATDDLKAEVSAAGYFNAARLDLSVGSIIEISADNDGTPGYLRLQVASMPAGGNITTTDVTTGQGGGAPAWIADNRGASISEQGVMGGGNLSWKGSRPRSLPFDLKRFYVVVPVFLPKLITGSTITDTLFADARSFAFAVAPWQADPNGRPAGTPVMFGSNPSASFDPATWDANAPLLQGGGVALVSSLVDLGANFIPAGTLFDWRDAIKVAAAGQIPLSVTVNGNVQTGHATAASTGDLTTGGIAGVQNLTAIPAANTAFWDNSIIVAEGPSGQKRIISVGDSKLYAVAYDLGDIEGVGGHINRGLKTKGAAHLNLGRGSDGDFNLQTPANWAMRKKLIQVLQALGATFTGRIHENIHNDLTKTDSIAAIARSTAYAKWACVNASGIGILVCTQAGTTDSAALSVAAGVNRDIVDGTVRWARISTTSGGFLQQAAAVAARNMNVNDQLRQILPGVPSFGWASEPGTTGQTTQTPLTNFGASTTKRGQYNLLARDASLWDLWGHTGIIDTNPAIELSYPPTETSAWADTNDTTDGTHHSTAGAIKAAAVVAAVAAL